MNSLKYLLVIAVAFSTVTMNGQDFARLDQIPLVAAEDYKPAEAQVLACANYLFNTPYKKDHPNRQKALRFITKWMMGTPDYTFEIGHEALELTKGNDDLFALYMAGLTKTALDRGKEQFDNQKTHEGSVDLLVDYCSDKANNMKPSKAIKKLIKERQG